MRKQASRLLLGALLASGLGGALPEAAAQALYTPPASVPRTCTIASGTTGSVQIIAGPDAAGALATVFPVPEACPFPFTGNCLRWDYRWIYNGFNPSNALVSVDADVGVLAAAPSATVTTPISGDSAMNYGVNVAGEVGLRFNSNATTFDAKIWTRPNVVTGTMTAGFHAGNRRGFCAIAGADGTTGDPNLSTTTQIQTSTLGCRVEWTLSQDGCVVSAAVTDGNCTIQESNLGINTISASCGTEIAVPGSCHVCRWNSFTRSYICTVKEDINPDGSLNCAAHTH